MDHQFLYAGLIRLHVLHHAEREAIYGLSMIEELRRHGYRVGPGTLYPILHGLETRGLLSSKQQRQGRGLRRLYRATPEGRRALRSAKLRVRELFGELFEGTHDGQEYLSAQPATRRRIKR
jgi:DNA-binding PadR family transcriptional regulator